MTREDAARHWPFLKAFAEGKDVEVNTFGLNSNDKWEKLSSDIFTGYAKYRIKPSEPTLRPWRPEEVPVGAQWRARDLSCKGIITYTGACNGIEMLSNFEHSLDNGKTWLPCGVYENE